MSRTLTGYPWPLWWDCNSFEVHPAFPICTWDRLKDPPCDPERDKVVKKKKKRETIGISLIQIQNKTETVKQKQHLNCSCQTAQKKKVTLNLMTYPLVITAPNISIWVCVSLQWLYPQRRQTAAVWRRVRREVTVNPPLGQKNSSSLK